MTLARLPAESRVYVVSDLHLGDGSASDSFGKKDGRFRAFLERVARDADALVIAGDGFDLAQAWTLERIVDAHRAVVDDLSALSRELEIHYLRGNHEGSARALRALPFRFADALLVGDRIRIEHGNAHDPVNLPGDRAAFWGSRLHAVMERAIRSPVRIPMRKHHYWSTRLGHWLFFRYGMGQRLLADVEGSLGFSARARQRRAFLDYWGRSEWGDGHGLLGAAQELLASEDIDCLVFGHSHQPGRVRLGRGSYVNTGSWTFEDSTYAALADGEAEVRSFPEERVILDEEYRGILGPNKDKSFFDWWDAYYRGWLRYDVEGMLRDARGDQT